MGSKKIAKKAKQKIQPEDKALLKTAKALAKDLKVLGYSKEQQVGRSKKKDKK